MSSEFTALKHANMHVSQAPVMLWCVHVPTVAMRSLAGLLQLPNV